MGDFCWSKTSDSIVVVSNLNERRCYLRIEDKILWMVYGISLSLSLFLSGAVVLHLDSCKSAYVGIRATRVKVCPSEDISIFKRGVDVILEHITLALFTGSKSFEIWMFQSSVDTRRCSGAAFTLSTEEQWIENALAIVVTSGKIQWSKIDRFGGAYWIGLCTENIAPVSSPEIQNALRVT